MFWSSQKLQDSIERDKLVRPFRKCHLECGHYELTLGDEIFLTNSKNKGKKLIDPYEQIVIPSGQFGILITEEIVRVPDNAIAFISIKAKQKFKGLVNISGFHVDPGYHGRLKFSVLNAGPREITLERGQKLFPIWYADLNEKTDPHKSKLSDNTSISSADVSSIQGNVASPAALKSSLDSLENHVKLLWALLIASVIGLWLKSGSSSQAPIVIQTPPSAAPATPPPATPPPATPPPATPPPATPPPATPSSATPSSATPSSATPSSATPSSATPSSATPSSATPSSATPPPATPPPATPPPATSSSATQLGK
jgi:dCTP deaminase